VIKKAEERIRAIMKLNPRKMKLFEEFLSKPSKETNTGRRLLRAFIANPSGRTLRKFADHVREAGYSHSSDDCLLRSTLYPFEVAQAHSFGTVTCPVLCHELALKRGARFNASYLGCRRWSLLQAWAQHPSELLLSLIEFDAYLDTL